MRHLYDITGATGISPRTSAYSRVEGPGRKAVRVTGRTGAGCCGEGADGEQRERIDERERVADERERVADEREAAADQREAMLDIRERELSVLQLRLDERARALLGSASQRVQRQQEALEVVGEVLARSEKRLSRARAAF